METALTEFLLTGLGDEKSVFSLGGVSGARAYHLQRICQRIETLLSEPDLTIGMVAQAEGVSTRYLQRLFTEAGNSFIHYLRTRRLERCRADLASSLHANLSISEICFRWGFNGSAHFSRAFRKEYGMSPREYRRWQQTEGQDFMTVEYVDTLIKGALIVTQDEARRIIKDGAVAIRGDRIRCRR